ncbi:MAG: hypothetical protein ACI4I9_09725 [Porcipelethomonas sp.]
MKVFLCECKKLMSFRIFWIVFSCLLLVNGYIQINRADERYYTPESYRSFFSETENMSLTEIQKFLNELLEQQSSGKYTAYPMYLIYDMLELSKECEEYPSYLNSIKEQADNMSSVSIWGDTDTFSCRNIQKTPSAYAAIPAEELPLAPSFGLENTFTSPVTDFIGIFLVFLSVCAVMLRDREQGIAPLLSALLRGRTYLLLTKLSVVSLCTSAIALLFFGENLVIGGCLYGLGDLHRPIQSVFGLYQCNLPVSAGKFLILFFMLKIASYLLFAVIFSLICMASKNNIMIYGISGGICAAAFLFYRFIDVNSVFQILHYWNPVKFTQTAEILGTYQNVNVLGYPVSLKFSSVLFISVLIAIMIFSCIWIAEKNQNVQYRTVRLNIFHRKKVRIHSRFYYVCYRSLVLNKGFLLVFAAIFASAMLSASFSRQYDNDDIYYENFTDKLEGAVTSDTLNYLTEKEEKYRSVEKEMEKIQLSGNVNTYKLNLLYNELNDRTAFERLNKRVQSIQSSCRNGEIFYDTGYERMFGFDGNKEEYVLILLIVLFTVFILSPVASADKKSDMVKIIFSTKCGKSGYYKDLLLYSILCGTFAGLLFTVPYVINILNSYGTQGLSAPIQSIQSIAGSSGSFTVGDLIVLLIIFRTIGSMLTAIIITGISSLCRSSMASYLISLALLTVPVSLVLLGADFMEYVSITPLLSFQCLISLIL